MQGDERLNWGVLVTDVDSMTRAAVEPGVDVPAPPWPRELILAPQVSPAPARWLAGYRRRLAATDAGVVLVALTVALLGRFGGQNPELAIDGASYAAVSVLLAVAWLTALSVVRSRDARIVGSGPEEYRRVANASLALFGALAVISYLFRLELARGYLLLALPVGLVGLIVGRWCWRQWLTRRRAEGHCTATVLVIGSHRAAAEMGAVFERSTSSGFRVVGVCVPGVAPETRGLIDVDGHRVPLMGDEHRVLAAVAESGADTVAVTNTDVLGSGGMRALAWQLEAVDVDLVVSPGVVDVAGPRLSIRPVAGLPLLHVEEPQYEGASRVGKLAVDWTIALIALVVLAPVWITAAVVVKVSSPGPVFYRAERVGLGGSTFPMWKFRTMVDGADRQHIHLEAVNQGAGLLFKLHRDPRVTPAGRWLRRFSIDELPQLLNVLRGQMSIVGPRPPLPAEVALYSNDVHRRLLVKPGVTGLWQVSGRSDLSWEESVRLDLSYVENWSIVQDLIIVWRTLRAVLRSRGAY